MTDLIPEMDGAESAAPQAAANAGVYVGPDMDLDSLLAILEAYLFVAAEPVKAAETARILGLDVELVTDAYEGLVGIYNDRQDGGLMLIKIAGGYQLCTRPDLAPSIAKLLAAPSARGRLSKPALETLAIVAYQQPVTSAEIESVRGVSVDGVLHTLMDRKLVREDGRKDAPGRPILYRTTDDFLHYFGLNSLEDLPPLEDVPLPEQEVRLEMTHDALAAVGLDDDASSEEEIIEDAG